ncbi:hypothetical protein FRC04_005246 [Tulasnella sp. 424]|nr:hypothetical protein FRC04_005246 [Tulasnella sp. 424]KAG8975682.1 hypothetical protein FRC05_005200 [Tulasnella sp. 425]
MITPVIGKGPAAIEYAIEKFKEDPGGVLGSWLLATIGITFMMGIFATQASRYFSAFGYESGGIFTVLMSCIVLSILQWILVLLAAWDWFVAHYGDWGTVVYISWPVWSEPIVAQVTVFVAQLFFAYRCYTLYRRNKFIFYGLILAMLASVVMFTMVGVALAIDSYNLRLNRQFTIPALCLNLFTDLTIAGLTLWKLWAGGEKSFSPNTDDVLRRLRNLTIEAAVPPAICAILNMSFFLALDSRRATVVFATTNGPIYAPNASMGVIGSDLQVDLDRWEKRPSLRPQSDATSVRTEPFVESSFMGEPIDGKHRA